ncbi:hypothetical protein M8818_002344 [Zalaria obscura]|uniref:Uncharacterized protein n=1 Tax=Zalaria obscura TaxID=2024903 RepID=A0ACC3SHJ2_9PEZI
MPSRKRAKEARREVRKALQAKARAAEAVEDDVPDPELVALQQKLLDMFRDACFSKVQSDFEETLQEVKGHLFDRNFAAAFGKDEYLQAYAARWSPSRALAYMQVFSDISSFIEEVERGDGPKNSNAQSASADSAGLEKLSLEEQANSSDEVASNDGNASSQTLRVACLGGGAGAEVVSFAGWMKTLVESENPPFSSFDVSCLDIARWDTVVADLDKIITQPKELSKYASAAAREANVPFLPPATMKIGFQQRDVLGMKQAAMDEALKDIDLVTLMFTLNELYTDSMPKTQRFLLQLTASLRPGSLLLVVDSPGSYSAVSINGAEKKYPMHFLLDYTLLQAPAKLEPPVKQWEKLMSDDSRWFRLPEGYHYPIELEDMRYQIHLYRRCGPEEQSSDA